MLSLEPRHFDQGKPNLVLHHSKILIVLMRALLIKKMLSDANIFL